MFLGDFHLHSTFSDGSLSIHDLVDLMGQAGMGSIAITDHLCEEKTFLGLSARLLSKTLTAKNFPQYLETIEIEAERAWRLYRMRVIAGVEITKNSFSHNKSAHIIALDIKKFINPDDSIETILKNIRDQDALSIAAHPVDTGEKEHQTKLLWHNREKLGSLIDAWEVASGRTLFHEVRESKVKKIASSDLHKPTQLNSWKTSFNCPKEIASIKEAICKQNIDFYYFESELAKTSCPKSKLHLLKTPVVGY